jgi:hypothetical protein
MAPNEYAFSSITHGDVVQCVSPNRCRRVNIATKTFAAFIRTRTFSLTPSAAGASPVLIENPRCPMTRLSTDMMPTSLRAKLCATKAMGRFTDRARRVI